MMHISFSGLICRSRSGDNKDRRDVMGGGVFDRLGPSAGGSRNRSPSPKVSQDNSHKILVNGQFTCLYPVEGK